MESVEATVGKVVQRLDRVEEDIREYSKDNRSTHERIFSRLEPLEKANALITQQYGQIMDVLKEMKSDIKSWKTELDDIKERPSRRLELIITAVISAVITAGVSIIIKTLGG